MGGSKKMGDIKSAAGGLDKLFSENEEKKTVKKVFSFRTLAESADDWRIWADAAGLKVDDLGTAALTEYIKNHPLTDNQKQIYELKKAEKNS